MSCASVAFRRPVAISAPRAFRPRLHALAAAALIALGMAVAGEVRAAAGPEAAATRAAVFVEPLVAATPADDAARARLVEAVQAYAFRAATRGTTDAYADVAPLQAYLAADADSPWRASLLANIGWRYWQLGYTSRALDFLAQAHEAAAALDRDRLDADARRQFDAVTGSLLELHASLGHRERTQALLDEPGTARLGEAAALQAQFARDALAQMRDEPELALRCAWAALFDVLRQQGADAALLNEVRQQRAGRNGSSLADLVVFARVHALDLHARRVAANEALPVPAVVHLRTGHFAAVLERRGEGRGELVRTIDAVTGLDGWIPAAALAAESSGYVLAAGSTHGNGLAVGDDEVRGVIGAGNPPRGDPNASGTQTPTEGGTLPEPRPHHHRCQAPWILWRMYTPGMPTYAVQALNVGLTIQDTPVSYSAPIGPGTAFGVFYSQNERNQPPVFDFSNLGAKWTHDWLAYITDDPAIPGNLVSAYFRGGGGWNYIGYNAADGSFGFEGSRVQLVRISGAPITYERRFPDGSKEVYAFSDGALAAPRRVFLTQVVDPNGNTVALSYDGLHRLMGITDAIGQTTTLNYVGDDLRIVGLTDPFGRTAQFAYDGQGRLAGITDAIGMQSTFAYDAAGNVVSMTTPYGTTSFAFAVVTKYRRWFEATDPLGQVERVEYNSGANNIDPSPVSPKGMAVENGAMNLRDTFYFDKLAYPVARQGDGSFDYRLAKIDHWAEMLQGGSTVVAPVTLATKKALENWEYTLYPHMVDGSGHYSPKTVTDAWLPFEAGRVMPNGGSAVSHSLYNELGNPTLVGDTLDRATSDVYAGNDIDLIQESHQDRSGHSEVTFNATYDSRHLPLTTTDASGSTTTYTYNDAGQMLTSTDALNQTTSYTYDARHFLLNVRNPAGAIQAAFTYDAVGRVASRTDSEGYTLTYTYDNLDRPLTVGYPDGTSELLVWSRLDLATKTDRLGHSQQFSYDALRRLVQFTDANNGVTTQTYDAAGNLVALTDANQHTTRWTRDLQGHVLSKTYPGGATFAYAYDNASREKTRRDALGQTRTTVYNSDGSVRQRKYSNGNTASQTYLYDRMYPRLVQMTDGDTGEVVNFSYVPAGSPGAGRLAGEVGSDPEAIPITYAYDALSRLVQRGVGESGSSYAYDPLGRLGSTVNAVGRFDYTYLGQTTQPTLENAIGTRWRTQFQWAGNLGDRMLHEISHPGTGAQTIAYATATGHVTGRTQGADAWAYARDAGDRLVDATHSGSGTGQGAHFAYDPADSLLQIQTTNPDSQTTFTTNADNQVTSVNADGVITNWIYDANGNVLDDGVNTYTWDGENRLVKSLRKSDGHLSRFSYDGLGRRILIREIDAADSTTTRYAWCGDATPCGARRGGALTTLEAQGENDAGLSPRRILYARDHQGSVMQTASVSGTLLGSQLYTPYGQPYGASGRGATVGYAGMFFHSPSGLNLTPNRAYCARSGRWLSRDPIGEAGGTNLFAYAGDSPIENVDPTGTIVTTPDEQFIFVYGNPAGKNFARIVRSPDERYVFMCVDWTDGYPIFRY
jgi:RHS repeat-associated protein